MSKFAERNGAWATSSAWCDPVACPSIIRKRGRCRHRLAKKKDQDSSYSEGPEQRGPFSHSCEDTYDPLMSMDEPATWKL